MTRPYWFSGDVKWVGQRLLILGLSGSDSEMTSARNKAPCQSRFFVSNCTEMRGINSTIQYSPATLNETYYNVPCGFYSGPKYCPNHCRRRSHPQSPNGEGCAATCSQCLSVDSWLTLSLVMTKAAFGMIIFSISDLDRAMSARQEPHYWSRKSVS